MQTLKNDLSAIDTGLFDLLRRYELNLEPNAANALDSVELVTMLETLDAARARLDSISRVVAHQLEARRTWHATQPTFARTEFETVEAAARRLGVTEQNIYEKARSGQIPGAHKLGRYWRIPRDWSGEPVC